MLQDASSVRRERLDLPSPGIQSDPAASALRQLPPPWAGVGVVRPLVPLEVVLYDVTIALLFDAF